MNNVLVDVIAQTNEFQKNDLYNYKIVKYSPTYKAGIIQLLENMWKEYDENGKYELFRWRYEDNPYEKSIIFLAVENEIVIGFRAFISQMFIKEGKHYIVFSPADTIVHHQHRRRGIISALNEKCLEEINMKYQKDNVLLINTSTSKPSMPVYLKQGWQKSNGLRRFYFKHSLFNYLHRKYKSFTKPYLSEPIELSIKNYKIEISPQVKSKELSIFNTQIRNSTQWTNIRDAGFFNWRYSFHPEKYTYLYCYRNGELQGYLILKHLTNTKYTIDQFEATNSKIIRLLIRSAFKILKIVQLRSYAFLPEEKKLLKKCGFMPEPISLLRKFDKQRFPVLVRPKQLQPQDMDFIIEGDDIREITNW